MSVLVAVDISEERARIVSANAHSPGRIDILSVGSINFTEFNGEQETAEPQEDQAPSGARVLEALRAAASPFIPEEVDHTFAYISGRPVLFETMHLPFKDPKNLGQVVPLQLQDLVPFDVSSVVVDPLPISEGADRRFEILASVLPREDIANSLQRLQQLGIDPEILTTPSSAASGLSVFLGDEDAASCYGLLLIAEDHASLTLVSEGAACVLREFPGPISLEDQNAIRAILQGVHTCIKRFESQTSRSISTLYLQGERSTCERMAGSLNCRTKYIDLSECYSLPANVSSTDANLGWALGLMARELSENKPLVNFRKGDYAYKPLWGNFVAALKEELTWIILAFFFICTWVGTQLYTVHSQLGRIEQGIEEEFRAALPGEPVQRGLEASVLQDKINNIEQQLRGLGSLSSLSPLESLKELSVAVSKDIDITISKINIGDSGLSFSGTVPDYVAVGKLNTALEQRKDRFCEVRVDSRNKEPGTNRIRYQAEVGFCE